MNFLFVFCFFTVRRATDNYVEKSENNDEALLNNNRINSAKSKEASLFDDIMNGKRQSISGFSFDENGVFVPLIKQAKSEESLLNSKEKQHLLRSPGFFRKKKTEVSPSISTFQSFVVEEEKKSVEGKRAGRSFTRVFTNLVYFLTRCAEKIVVQFDFTKHRRFSPGTRVSSRSNAGPIRGAPFWTSRENS